VIGPAPTFLELLARSGLLSREQVAQFAGDGPPREQATRLEAAGLLTPFQSRQLLRGRWRGFHLAGSFRILELLGGGSTGWVYLVEDLDTGHLAAAKVLTQSEEHRVPFWNEARILTQCVHANIVTLLDVVVGGPSPFLLLEFIDGTDLHALTTRINRVEPGRAVHWAMQALHGLRALHTAGFVHGDVKPGNLSLTRGGVVKLLDFGNTRRLGTRADGGTPNFAAPEQLAGEVVDARTDLYSLGATLAFLLTGRPAGELPSDVPAGLRDVIRLLMQTPDERITSASEALHLLQPWAAESAPPRPEELPRWSPMVRRRLNGRMPRSPQPDLRVMWETVAV
jgi:eukaryotic-like serine/threonine-protein kinase